MSLSIESTVDLIQRAAVSLIVISLFVYGGWGLILRIILTPLKIKTFNKTFKRLDDYLLELQLIKLYHGINVTSKNDAKLVFQAISQGILFRGDFKLLRFAPPIGLKKSNVSDVWLAVLMVIVCLILDASIMSTLNESKYNHAVYTQEKEKVLVSHSNIYDIQSKKYFLKTDCRKINNENDSILYSACEYLLTEDKDKQDELTWAINKSNNAIISLYVLMVILFTISMISLTLSMKYYEINNKFYDFKLKRQERVDNPVNGNASTDITV
ncbi:Uncharacterised protein [Citrobacter freundii]|uniref:hypothetical protein n=1 Tax=Citrobacter braakii TaxID=57706 RepID=UPI000DF10BB7|nr:hypothetical protein [Citrobacter braakii]MBJ9241811.1 hypothetical protein [Citrobacter braakii]STA74781.1 Uncharacterised protein [Citrobacter freundii]SUX72917.1 Uncharacterised protein [Citrobacter freundii]